MSIKFNMLSKLIVVYFLCAGIGFCQSAIVDNIQKCSIKDYECQKNLYQHLLSTSAKNGIPDVGMPQTDPFVLKNESVTILDLITATMIDGTANGVKNCVIHKVRTDLEARNFTMDFSCDFLIKGRYKLSSNPAVKTLLGGDVHGEGVSKVEIEKVHVKAGFEFFVKKGKNDEIYFDYKYEGMKFAFNFGKVRIYADSIYIGDQELSKVIVPIINDNWKFFLTTFGKPFVQKGMDFFFQYTHMWYDNVPAKDYIIEDLSPYLTN